MPQAQPQAPLGHLARLGFTLARARDLDEVASCMTVDLAALPGVLRVGFALSEGGGRRLRYTASDRDHSDGIDWCHIDAYDDVPLTRVMRTGQAILTDRRQLERLFPEYGVAQDAGVLGIAVVPLPGVGSPVGGFLLLLDRPWADDQALWRLLEAAARRAAEAVRRGRVNEIAVLADPALDDAARLSLSDDPRSAGQARRFLRDFLAAHEGVSAAAADTAQLCLSELVTNALVHAGGGAELRVTLRDAVLTVTVRDHGVAGAPIGTTNEVSAESLRVHGRGLQLVEMLVDRWGSDRDAYGSTVWFELRVDGPAAAPGGQRTG